jgi:glutamate dehydrogenase/leucine dehydrogenase
VRRYIKVMARMAEPERMVAFRVAWVDDKGEQQVGCASSARL